MYMIMEWVELVGYHFSDKLHCIFEQLLHHCKWSWRVLSKLQLEIH